MIPIQEVDFYSDNGIRISANVVVPNPDAGISGAEVIVYDPALNSLYSAYQTIGQYNDSKSAFSAITEFAHKYIEKPGGNLVRVNNPFNTEFVTSVEQQKVVDAMALDLTVEVNA
jgi:hypothetical protein